VNRTRFVVLGGPRTGTSLMIETLDAHPQIRCYGGVFNRGSRGALDPDADDVAHWIEQLFTSEARLDQPQIQRPEAREGPRAVGFKVHYEQWLGRRAREVLRLLPDLRIVHVVRDDVLRTLISAKVAAARESYQSRQAPAGPPAPVHIDREELEVAAHNYAASRSRFERDFEAHARIEVEYQAWRRQRVPLLRRVQSFIRVPIRDDLSTDLVKTGTSSLEQALSNFETLREEVRGTPLARYFDPD